MEAERRVVVALETGADSQCKCECRTGKSSRESPSDFGEGGDKLKLDDAYDAREALRVECEGR